MKNKRVLGQHFLISEGVKEKIFNIIKNHCYKCNAILEVGGGSGELTQYLKKINKKLFVIELDKTLSEKLAQKFNGIDVLNVDGRKFDISSLKEFSPLLICGNLPYYAARDIILNILSKKSLISSCHFMFQREFAKKLVAISREKNYSKISVWVQTFYEVEIEFSIGKGAFIPQPKVVSSFVTFLPKQDSFILEDSFKDYYRFLNDLFKEKRKKLVKKIKELGLNCTLFLDKYGENFRVQDISKDDFINLFIEYYKKLKIS